MESASLQSAATVAAVMDRYRKEQSRARQRAEEVSCYGQIQKEQNRATQKGRER
jgi:hypothetical protein